MPTIGPSAAPIRTTALAVYTCPSDPAAGVYTVLDANFKPVVDAATNSYAASFGAGGNQFLKPKEGTGMFVANGRFEFRHIGDGLSNTIAISERPALYVKTPWAGVLDQGTVRTTPGCTGLQLVHPPIAVDDHRAIQHQTDQRPVVRAVRLFQPPPGDDQHPLRRWIGPPGRIFDAHAGPPRSGDSPRW